MTFFCMVAFFFTVSEYTLTCVQIVIPLFFQCIHCNLTFSLVYMTWFDHDYSKLQKYYISMNCMNLHALIIELFY